MLLGQCCLCCHCHHDCSDLHHRWSLACILSALVHLLFHVLLVFAVILSFNMETFVTFIGWNCHVHLRNPNYYVILHQGCLLILYNQSLHNSNHLHVQILRPWLSICKSAFLFLGEQWDDDKISPLCQHPRVDCHTSYFRVILIPKLCCLVGARSMMAGWLLAASSSMWLGSQSAIVHASSVLVFWHTGLHFQTGWWLALRAAPKVLAVGTASCRQPLATRQLLEKYFVHYESLLPK